MMRYRERERIFGYLPMSTHLMVQPEKVTEAGFVDGSPHRSALPATYQQYTRVKGDPGYDEAYEDQQAIFRPLFMTSFLIDDFLAENDFFGASAVLLASASSKTALGVAFLLSRRQGARCEVIALTSPSNVEFCERLGYYDRVLTYEDVRSLPPDTPTVLVDMAGDGELLHAVHTHSAIPSSTAASSGLRTGRRARRRVISPGQRPSSSSRQPGSRSACRTGASTSSRSDTARRTGRSFRRSNAG